MDSRKYTESATKQLRREMVEGDFSQRVQFCVSTKQLKQIKRLAKKDDRSVSNFVRNAVITSMKLT